MKPWVTKALELLRAGLTSLRHELTELDRKVGLSIERKRLTEHLSAFANQPGGGFFVFGVDATGAPRGVAENEAKEIGSTRIHN